MCQFVERIFTVLILIIAGIEDFLQVFLLEIVFSVMTSTAELSETLKGILTAAWTAYNIGTYIHITSTNNGFCLALLCFQQASLRCGATRLNNHTKHLHILLNIFAILDITSFTPYWLTRPIYIPVYTSLQKTKIILRN